VRVVMQGAVLVTLASLATISVAGAELPASGTYDIFVGGQRAGSERFTWSESDDGGAVLEGESVLDVGGVSTTLRPSLTIEEGTLLPVRYSRDAQAGDRLDAVDATFLGGKAILELEQNGTSSKRNLKIKPADLVVDDNVLSLFTMVARKYDFEKGGEQEFSVFDTQAQKTYQARCMTRGLGVLETSAGKFRLKRLTINLEDVGVDLLVDDDGTVAQISVPLQRLEARLSGYAGPAKSNAENVQ
jgi:hypothetical protein